MTALTRTTLSIALLFVFFHSPLQADTKPDKMKQRLEELFLWRVSDRLKLTPAEEELFQTEHKKLADEKKKLMAQADSLLEQIGQNKTDKKKSQALINEYLGVMTKVIEFPVREAKSVEKLFGPQRTAEYVLLKHEMTQRFKDALKDRHQASTDDTPTAISN